jgi:hypothetical protein
VRGRRAVLAAVASVGDGSIVRGLLALYTIACPIYIVVRASSAWELPPLETKLFPWQ